MESIYIPLSEIQSNPRQPRTEFDAGEMASLVESVKHYGILQPLLVTIADGGIYVLIAGERRLRAAREAGLEEVPVVIVPEASERDQLELALIENIQRVDLNPLEKARAYQQLVDDFSLSHEDIAAKVGVHRTTVTNALRLLKLPEEINTAMLAGSISERQAAALLTLFDLPESLRKEAESQYGTARPSSIVAQALDGLSSDGIRELIEDLVRHYSEDLNQAIWGLDYIFVTGEAIYWPECRTCELRHKPLNVCTDPSCYEAKTRAWKADYLRGASQVSGIVPLEADIGIYEATQLSYRSSAQPILTSGCENLRLAYQPRMSGPFSLEEKGFPNAVIVCRQKNGHCQCLKGLEILEAKRRRESVQAIQDTPRPEAASPEEEEIPEEDGAFTTVYYHEAESAQPAPAQPTAEDLAELVRQEKRNEKGYKKQAQDAQDRAAQIIVDGLAADEPGAWRLIYDRVATGERWEGRPTDVFELRKGIAEKIIKYHVNYTTDPDEVSEKLKELLIGAGLQVPVF